MDTCPNCGDKIAPNAFFSPNSIVDQQVINLINHYADDKKEAYCLNCYTPLYNKANGKLQEEIHALKQQLGDEIGNLPCLNLQMPQGWDYEPMGIVTGQSTMGTGIISELSSNWNDFFGLESRTMNRKILKGEENCMNILKSKCVSLGGNAVIGIDIDYSEIGGLKNMIMVCATGTAIRLKNPNILPEETHQSLLKIKALQEQMQKFIPFGSMLFTVSR